jgi:hypothetical protein
MKNLPLRFLLALMMFGAAVSIAGGDSAAGDVATEYAASSMTADATTHGEGALLSGGTVASAFAAFETGGARGAHRQVHPAWPRPMAAATKSLSACTRHTDVEHRQQLHFARAGSDGLHTSTPPPTANG